MIFIFYIPILVLIGLAILYFSKGNSKSIFWLNYMLILLTFSIPFLGFEVEFITFVIVFIGVAILAPITSFIIIVLLLPLIISYLTIGLHKSIFYKKTDSKY